MRVETVCIVDQHDATLQEIAQQCGLDEGICGYISTIFALNMVNRQRPTSRSELAAFVETLRKELVIAPNAVLRQSMQAIKERRQKYMEQHPNEFATEGQETWDSETQRQRVSPNYFLRSQFGVVDVAWILSSSGQSLMDDDKDGSQKVIPLVITVPTAPHVGSYGDSLTDLLQALPFSEDRDWVSVASRCADSKCQSAQETEGVDCCLMVQSPTFGNDNDAGSGMWKLQDLPYQKDWRTKEKCCPAVLYYGDHFVCVVPLSLPPETGASDPEAEEVETLLVLETVPMEESQQHQRWQPAVYAKALSSTGTGTKKSELASSANLQTAERRNP